MKHRTREEKISLAISISLHVLIVLMLTLSFERTIHISAPPSDNKPIIEATMISKKTLQEEVKRLEQKEALKKEQEEKRILEKVLAQKEKEAKIKHEKEVALKKKEELKKQELKLAQEKKELEAKLKQEKEDKEKKEIEKKKKEEEELAKKKADIERKVAQEKAEQALKDKELAEQKAKEAQQQANAQPVNPRVLQNEINRIGMLMRNKIHQNWRQPIGFDYDGLKCKIAVKLLPTGEVVQARVIESSGSLEFDRSAELAVKKASPLPMPQDTTIAKEFRDFSFTFYPEAA